MAILCDFDGVEKQYVVHEVLQKMIDLTEGNQQKLREYITMLEILASNRSLNLDIQQEFKMLRVEIEKLPSFVMGMEQGIDQGIEKGEKMKARVIAKQLLEMGMSREQVSQATGLTDEERLTLI